MKILVLGGAGTMAQITIRDLLENTKVGDSMRFAGQPLAAGKCKLNSMEDPRRSHLNFMQTHYL